MSWPKHALKTEDALVSLHSAGITKVYLVTPKKAWYGCRIESIDTSTIESYPHQYKKRWLKIGDHKWWIWPGEARIPPGSPQDTEKSQDDTHIYMFTNYWHAYAQWLKVRGS